MSTDYDDSSDSGCDDDVMCPHCGKFQLGESNPVEVLSRYNDTGKSHQCVRCGEWFAIDTIDVSVVVYTRRTSAPDKQVKL